MTSALFLLIILAQPKPDLFSISALSPGGEAPPLPTAAVRALQRLPLPGLAGAAPLARGAQLAAAVRAAVRAGGPQLHRAARRARDGRDAVPPAQPRHVRQRHLLGRSRHVTSRHVTPLVDPGTGWCGAGGDFSPRWRPSTPGC